MSNAIIGMIKPLAKQYINAENINAVFDQICEKYTPEQGEKVVLLISKKSDGSVNGSVAAMDSQNRITGVYDQMRLDQLIMTMLEKL